MERNKIAGIRREYTKGKLTRCSISDDPFIQFNEWLDDAVAAGEASR